MGKPRLIILVRHAQSEGNKNRAIHQTVPDHRVKLTEVGHQQAKEAGTRLLEMLSPTDTLQFYTSPYLRTRSTTEGMISSLKSHPNFNKIKVYEEPRLREQDFGNFQPCTNEMTRMWHERAAYGHFFYRIPNGESAADAYDRISGFNESLWRQFADPDFPSVLVLVTHGLMTRIFLMKWYHYSVEYFEDLRNVNHCEFMIMKKDNTTGKYILQNELRTWSAYQAEQRRLREEAKAKAGEQDITDVEEASKLASTALVTTTTTVESTGTITKQYANGTGAAAAAAAGTNGNGTLLYSPGIQYGGCPHGCSHSAPPFEYGNATQFLIPPPPTAAALDARLKTQQRILAGGRDGGGSRSGHGSDDDDVGGGSGYESDGSAGEEAEVRRERKERVGMQAEEARRDCEGLEEGEPYISPTKEKPTNGFGGVGAVPVKKGKSGGGTGNGDGKGGCEKERAVLTSEKEAVPKAAKSADLPVDQP